MLAESSKIPVGFSQNDFFYKNVTVPINVNSPENSNLCTLTDDELRQKITQYYNDLDVNITGNQPKITSRNESINYFNKFNVTNPGAIDNGIPNFPKYIDGKNELIEI